MGPEVKSFAENDDIDRGGQQKTGDRDRTEQAVGKTEVLPVQICDSHNDDNGSRGEYADSLPKRAKESVVEIAVSVAGYQRAEWSRLGVEPGDRDCLKRVRQAERHTHLAGGNGAPICEQYRVEELIDEVSAQPAHGDTPLEWPDFLPPVNPILPRVAAQETQEELAFTKEP